MDFLVAIILSILFGVVPMAIYAGLLSLFDRYEKEPPLLMVGVFLWGLIVAAGSALILNTAFGIGIFVASGSEGLTNLAMGVVSAPLVEETVKGLAVLGVFIYFHNEFDSILDGIIYGSLVGFGFAAAENINYIYNGYLEGGFGGLAFLVFVRAVLIAFLHATLTSFTGIGFAIGRLNKGVLAFAGPVFGYVTAISLHAFHNLLASTGDIGFCVLGSAIDWLGFLAMFALILALVWREGKVMRDHLLEEVNLGNLSSAQYESACSVGGQVAARWNALTGGRWRKSARFYDLCGELAFKKYQLARLGPDRERAALSAIERLRRELVGLKDES
jgi:RsiW-degrading membrane proteinase PrsW (M82 family)